MTFQAPRRSGRISVRCVDDSYGVYAEVPINADEVVFIMEGETTATPSRISVQIGMDTHIDIDSEALQDPAGVPEGFFWQYLNHSCEPSVYIKGRSIYAMRPLQPGDHITFDYNTTELHMASPFACECGSVHCLETIRGFAHLSPAQRQRIEPYVASYLLDGLEEQRAAMA